MRAPFLFPISRVILNTRVLILILRLRNAGGIVSLISARIVLGQWIVTRLDTPVNAHMSSNLDPAEINVFHSPISRKYAKQSNVIQRKSFGTIMNNIVSGRAPSQGKNSHLVSWSVKKCSDTGKEC